MSKRKDGQLAGEKPRPAPSEAIDAGYPADARQPDTLLVQITPM